MEVFEEAQSRIRPSRMFDVAPMSILTDVREWQFSSRAGAVKVETKWKTARAENADPGRAGLGETVLNAARRWTVTDVLSTLSSTEWHP